MIGQEDQRTLLRGVKVAHLTQQSREGCPGFGQCPVTRLDRWQSRRSIDRPRILAREAQVFFGARDEESPGNREPMQTAEVLACSPPTTGLTACSCSYTRALSSILSAYASRPRPDSSTTVVHISSDGHLAACKNQHLPSTTLGRGGSPRRRRWLVIRGELGFTRLRRARPALPAAASRYARCRGC